MARLKTIHWWEWWPFRSWRIVAEVGDADEIPSRLPRNGVVLVGSLHAPKWLGFDCPCRNGHRVLLNLQLRHLPRWRLIENRPLTVLPSVDERGPAGRCHYFMRQGKIVWT
jgi:Family of unknown function (DUF6527)